MNDTHPEIEAVMYERLRAMSIPRRLELVDGLNQTVRGIAMQGLRQRHPGASEKELRWRFVSLLYGEEMAKGAFGPLPLGESDAGE